MHVGTLCVRTTMLGKQRIGGRNTGSFSSSSWCYRSTHALSRCASEKSSTFPYSARIGSAGKKGVNAGEPALAKGTRREGG